MLWVVSYSRFQVGDLGYTDFLVLTVLLMQIGITEQLGIALIWLAVLGEYDDEVEQGRGLPGRGRRCVQAHKLRRQSGQCRLLEKSVRLHILCDST